MSTRTFRPGFHRTQFFGTVPAARIYTPLTRHERKAAGAPVLREYAVFGRDGREGFKVCAPSLTEALRVARMDCGTACGAVVLQRGEFHSGGGTVRVREGNAIP